MCTSRLMRHVSGLGLDTESDLPSFCDAIKQSKSLITVNLYGIHIGSVGASAIAEAIKQSKSLTTADLSCNTVNLR